MIKAKITIFDDETDRIFVENYVVSPVSTVCNPEMRTTKYIFKEFIFTVMNELEVEK